MTYNRKEVFYIKRGIYPTRGDGVLQIKNKEGDVTRNFVLKHRLFGISGSIGNERKLIKHLSVVYF